MVCPRDNILEANSKAEQHDRNNIPSAIVKSIPTARVVVRGLYLVRVNDPESHEKGYRYLVRKMVRTSLLQPP
jgi:hypothetical protein